MSFNDLMKELKYVNIVFTALVMLAAVVFYRFEIQDIRLYSLLGVYFVFVFLLGIDSRLPIAGALLLLIMTPFFLIRNLENYANYLATLAYFLLVIGVIKQFVEYIREGKKPNNNG